MIIFALEASCDDTSVAVFKDDKWIFFETITQTSHAKHGGVILSDAVKEHIINLQKLIFKVIKELNLKEIDYFAYSSFEGLEPCLIFSKTIALTFKYLFNCKIIPINHLYAHAFIPFFDHKATNFFPFVGIVLSGANSVGYYFQDFENPIKIVEKNDNPIGHVFDRVGNKLKLPYPSGKTMECLAIKGKKEFQFTFPKTIDYFSFSGFLSQSYRIIEREQNLNIYNFCYSFQEEIFQYTIKILKNVLLLKKLGKNKVKYLTIGGGVACNKFLQNLCLKNFSNCLFAKDNHCTDNALMIGYLARLIISNASEKEKNER
ncbi:hypothetical protein JTY60_01125 [symbiont of Argiope bruennichi]|uniref:hypothetical protein n=1 Tax=symbiont of Argiope bruennichi TaxID=2810479 RepID=UPI003DA38EDB